MSRRITEIQGMYAQRDADVRGARSEVWLEVGRKWGSTLQVAQSAIEVVAEVAAAGTRRPVGVALAQPEAAPAEWKGRRAGALWHPRSSRATP